MTKMPRVLKYASAALAILLLFFAALVRFALTPWGMTAAVSLAEKMVPQLTVASTEGTLLDASLEGVSYRTPSATFTSRRIAFSLANLRPLERHFDLKSLTVDNLTINLAGSSADGSDDPAPALIALPVSVDIADAKFSNTVFETDSARIAAERIAFSGHAAADKAVVQALAVSGVDIVAQTPALTKSSAAPRPLAARIEEFVSNLRIEPIHVERVPLTIDIKSLELEDVRLNDDTAVETASASILLKPDTVHVKALALSHPLVRISAQGKTHIGGVLKSDMKARIEPRTEPFAAYPLTAEVQADLADAIDVSLKAGPETAPLHVRGRLSNGQTESVFYIAATGDLNLTPLASLTSFEGSLRNLELTLAGTFKNYTTSAKAQLHLPLLTQPADVALSADGQKLTWKNLQVHAAFGANTAAANLEASLTDENVSAQGSVKANWTELKTVAALLKTDLPASKGAAEARFAATAASNFAPESLALDVASFKTTATVDGTAFTAKGAAALQGPDNVTVKNLLVEADGARLTADAKLTKNTLSSTFTVASDDLSRLNKSLSGRIFGTGTLAGTTQLPKITSQLQASSVRISGLSINQADIVLLVTTLREKSKLVPKAEVRIQARQLTAANKTVDSADVTLSGTQEKHTLTLALTGKPATLNAQLTGRLDAQNLVWSGTLESARAVSQAGIWLTAQKPSVSVDPSRLHMEVSPHCWKSDAKTFELCVTDKAKLGRAGELKLSAKDADLNFIQRLVPIAFDIAGRADAKATLRWTAPEVKSAEASLELMSRSLAFTFADAPQPIKLDQTKIQASFTPQKARVQSFLTLSDGGAVEADISVLEPFARKELAGSVKAQDVDLAQFNTVFQSMPPRLAARGRISADISPRGTLARPELFGDVKLTDFTARGRAMPFELKPSRARLHLNGTQTTLTAILNTAQGDLRIRGSAEWSDPENPTAKVAVNGRDVLVNLPPYVSAHITPDVEASLSRKRLKLSGSVLVDQAHVALEKLPAQAVSASADEELVKPKQSGAKADDPLRIESSLVIRLGEDVNLTAFGLTSDLEGALTLKQHGEALGLSGTLNLIDGTFKAYGQDLVISKGHVTFAGPVNKPILNIEAIRNPESIDDYVTAGIRITGPSTFPKTEIFSDPPMSQAEAMSYIMRGQSLESADNSDNEALTAALLSVGLSQTGQFVSEVAHLLKVIDLNVSTTGAGDDYQVVVSGYVLPGLQVKYSMGLFDSIATITVRYRLLAQLFVEASSGAAHSLDLLYSFDF